MNGPGKYDDVCTMVRERTEARAVLVVVIDGKLGNGFSFQGDPLSLASVPEILEDVAGRIREDRAAKST